MSCFLLENYMPIVDILGLIVRPRLAKVERGCYLFRIELTFLSTLSTGYLSVDRRSLYTHYSQRTHGADFRSLSPLDVARNCYSDSTSLVNRLTASHRTLSLQSRTVAQRLRSETTAPESSIAMIEYGRPHA